MDLHLEGAGPIRLDQAHFLAQGGQGSVYVREGRAYKVFADPAAAMPQAKLAELSRLRHPAVVRPEALLRDARGRPCGYSMRFVADAEPLCRLIPKGFRARNGLDQGCVLQLIEALREALEALHCAGVCVVDLNEMNVLVDASFEAIHLIDADSFQTRSFPATAVTETIRDRRAPPGVFDAGTDWFAFAVLSFELLCGVHPYKGTHPRVKGLDARMEAELSAFDPEVSLPPSADGPEVIPEPLRSWLRSVLQEGHRGAPPGGTRAAQPPPAVEPGGLVIEEIHRYPELLLAWSSERSPSIAVTRGGVYRGPHRLAPAPAPPVFIAFEPRSGRPVLLSPAGLFDPIRREPVSCPLALDGLTAHRGQVFARCGDRLVELTLHLDGERLRAAPRRVAQVLPRATRLFAGLAVQALPGGLWLSVLGHPQGCPQVHLTELQGWRVVDALHEGGVVALLVERGGRYDRCVLRVDAYGHDLRRTEDVGPGDLDLVVLDSGVCLLRDEAGRLELFAARRGEAALRVLDLDLPGDLRLARDGGLAAFVQGARSCRMSLQEG